MPFLHCKNKLKRAQNVQNSKFAYYASKSGKWIKQTLSLLSYKYKIYQVRLEFRKLFDILVHPSDDGQTNRQINRISTYRLDPRKGSSKNKWKLQYPSVKDLFAIKKNILGKFYNCKWHDCYFFPSSPSSTVVFQGDGRAGGGDKFALRLPSSDESNYQGD